MMTMLMMMMIIIIITCTRCRRPGRIGSVELRRTVQHTLQRLDLKAAVTRASSPVQGCGSARCHAHYRPPGRNSDPACCIQPRLPPGQ